MSLLIEAGRSPVGIQQQTAIGGSFDGTAPAGDPVAANGMNKYSALTAGGLFNFAQGEPIKILQYQFDLGASVAYSIAIVNLDSTGAVISGESMVIDTGTSRYPSTRTPFWLTARQALQIIVAGAAVRFGQVIGVIEKN
jgi:hypothetical protein